MDMNIKPEVALNITPESNVQQQASQKWLCILPGSHANKRLISKNALNTKQKVDLDIRTGGTISH